MAKFKRDLLARRQNVEKRPQSWNVLPEVRRELKQDDAELVAQCVRATQQLGDVRFRLLQALFVGDAARCFQREGKMIGYLLRPLRQHRFGGHPVECVVDLYCRKMLREVVGHFAYWK